MLYVQVHIHILLFQSQKGIHKGDGERKIVREKEGEAERERERDTVSSPNMCQLKPTELQ